MHQVAVDIDEAGAIILPLDDVAPGAPMEDYP